MSNKITVTLLENQKKERILNPTYHFITSRCLVSLQTTYTHPAGWVDYNVNISDDNI